MSKSFKFAQVNDYSFPKTKKNKRRASKMVRKSFLKIPDGGGYKKLYNSYNIFDYKKLKLKENDLKYKRK